jgi:hypothetical protein
MIALLRRRLVLSLLCVSVLAGAGCAEDEVARGELVAPPSVDGKVDVASSVAILAALDIDGEESERVATSEFVRDLEFHGFTVDLRAGATFDVEVTQRGSRRRLDTTLYVYGPRDEANGFGDTALAFDDDAGWGLLSRLRGLTVSEAGTYLVVVGTHDGRDRGRYRLLATCAGEACGPELAPTDGECDARFMAAIDACVADWMADPDYDPSTTSVFDLIDGCADVEPLAPVWDEICAGGAGEGLFCDAGETAIESFALEVVPVCRSEARAAQYDRTCVFGDRYRDMWRAPGAIVRGETRELRDSDTPSALMQAQVVRAVQETAFSDVTTYGEAIAVVDEQVANYTPLWDASGRRAFVVIEVGAGDNSFGAYFPADSAVPVATINDGDIEECGVTWGEERRQCGAGSECAEGMLCLHGEFGPGWCAAPTLDDHAEIGVECADAAGCPFDEGLVCAGETGGWGLCGPAWMRGHYYSEPALAVPDNDAEGVEATLLVTGLTSVSTDVWLDLLLNHSRVSDLRATLINPSGTEVVVYDGSTSGSEVYYEHVPVLGFPGDESANGVWRLRVVDTRSGQSGGVGRFGLTVSSRWD